MQSTDISGRNTGCSAKLKVRIQKDTENTRRKKGGDYIRRGLLCVVTVDKKHNHSLHTADSLRELRMTTETRDTFSEYFSCGMRPSAALNHHSPDVLKDTQEASANINMQ